MLSSDDRKQKLKFIFIKIIIKKIMKFLKITLHLSFRKTIDVTQISYQLSYIQLMLLKFLIIIVVTNLEIITICNHTVHTQIIFKFHIT